jgi:uncharacterized protein
MGLTRPFLTAFWRNLAILNYEVDPGILSKYLPQGTELDTYQGKTFVSMVAFLFQNTRVLGLAIPFHCNFEEINLGFYVKYQVPGAELRRGVVFVREIVPRAAIAFVARTIYEEKYISLPTKSTLEFSTTEPINPTFVEYKWKFRRVWNSISVKPFGAPQELLSGSVEEFITEHYWGYTKLADGGTCEYQVKHPRWRIWSVEAPQLECDVNGLYGSEFEKYLSCTPHSAFLAEGAPVEVYSGKRIC